MQRDMDGDVRRAFALEQVRLGLDADGDRNMSRTIDIISIRDHFRGAWQGNYRFASCRF